MNPHAGFVGALELRAAADAIGAPEALRFHALAFVGHRQPLTALGAPALQHDSAVLGRHADTESVSLLAAPCVRLVGTSALCHAVPLRKLRPGGCLAHRHDLPRRYPDELSILAVGRWWCQKHRAAAWPVVQFAGTFGPGNRRKACLPFGFSPKISTPVENIVENTGSTRRSIEEPRFVAGFRAAKLRRSRFFGHPQPVRTCHPRNGRAPARRKSGFSEGF